MTSFLWGILVVVAAWAGNRIFQRVIDKTVGQHIDAVVDSAMEATFEAMKTYLEKHTPSEVEIKAQNGDPEAQFNLGNMYYKGLGTEKNYNEAIRWYREASRHDHAGARQILQQLGESW